jgi:hypothetical protein
MPFNLRVICALVSGAAFAYMSTGFALRWSQREDRANMKRQLDDLRNGSGRLFR